MQHGITEVVGLSPRFRRCLCAWLAIWFAIVSVLGNPVLAQTGGSDFEAPVIEHEEVPTGTWGDTESFVATVVDNDVLKRVSLFYRYAGETEFREVEMTPLASSSYFTASVDTQLSTEPQSAIEYYIRAEDLSGNLVVKGFTFEPLVRTLVNPNPVASEAVSAQNSGSIEPEPRKGINWLYVGLGVLLLGGIAAGAGGGGGSDDDGGPGESPAGCGSDCQVTLTIGTP